MSSQAKVLSRVSPRTGQSPRLQNGIKKSIPKIDWSLSPGKFQNASKYTSLNQRFAESSQAMKANQKAKPSSKG